MRLDHIAYRVKDRNNTAKFFMKAFGYTKQQEFELTLPDGSVARCIALEPPEKLENNLPWAHLAIPNVGVDPIEYHLAPEIFVSDGPPGSVIGDWVANRAGVGGVHHMAYMVNSVADEMDRWRGMGYKFLSDKPLHCKDDDPELYQVFTEPCEVTGGVIYEFIQRGKYGFCKANVANLMDSTKDCK
jgi:4-hydroxyphenylpyruvate dioxygenase-like putative hemolysin